MTGQQFKEKLAEAENPVVVDVWAPWCRPCRVLSPLLEEVSVEYKGRVDLWKFNADEESEVSAALDVKVIPTVIVFNNEQEITRVRGSQSRAAVLRLFETALGNEDMAGIQPVAWLEVAIWVVAGLVLVAGSWLSGGSKVLLAVGCLLVATGLLKIIKRD